MKNEGSRILKKSVSVCCRASVGISINSLFVQSSIWLILHVAEMYVCTVGIAQMLQSLLSTVFLLVPYCMCNKF